MSKQSIPYWVKRTRNGGGDFYGKLTDACLAFAAAGGDHPQIAFEGSSTGSLQSSVLELGSQLYAEYAKKAGAMEGLYCTWRHVADKMAASLKLEERDVLLIPGFGFGALYEAARRIQPRMQIGAVEVQPWLVRIAEAAEVPVIHGDFVDGCALPLFVTKVLCNPPMGRVYGQQMAEAEFMTKIADITDAGHLVAILLPGGPGEWWGKLRNKHAWLEKAFEVKEAELIANAAAPKSITVTRYLLERV